MLHEANNHHMALTLSFSDETIRFFLRNESRFGKITAHNVWLKSLQNNF